MKQIKVKRDIISPGKSMMKQLYTVHLVFFPRNLAVTNRIKCFAAAPVTASCFHRTDKKNRPLPH